MLHSPPVDGATVVHDDISGGAYQSSVQVTPGFSDSEGSWVQAASSGEISEDVVAVYVSAGDTFDVADASNRLFDIGVDPAGGTSYSVIIENVVCGGKYRGDSTGTPNGFLFPISIKAGSSVAVRAQTSMASTSDDYYQFKFYGQGSHPELLPVGSFAETIGAVSGSVGSSFTPGTSSWGSWTSLGTTTNPLWWWQLAFQVNNNTWTTNNVNHIELAYGDGTNYVRIQHEEVATRNNETMQHHTHSNLNLFECYQPVPAGATIYIRGYCDGTPDSGWNAVAIGIG